MKCRQALLCSLFCMLLLSVVSHAQLWSGILKPTYGTGACTVNPGSSPAACAIDWTVSGIPGGIPNRSTICATIQASTYGNGSSDATSGIQSAITSCASAHAGDVNGSPGGVVLLSSGTFLLNSTLNLASNVTLRGAGAPNTILNAHRTSGAVVNMGSGYPSAGNSTSITSGATAGSQSFVVSSASGISVGSYLMITELNDPSYVSIVSSQDSGNNCTWCDYSQWNGTRVRGQTVEVASVNGTTIGFTPPLYTNYSNTPLATYFTAAIKWAGLENLQIYSNGTASYGQQSTTTEGFYQAAYCWIKGVENNYTDGDHVQTLSSYRVEMRDNYFSGAMYHQAGQTDGDVNLMNKTSGALVENNIMERMHTSMFYEYGSSGNVFAYNFSTGAFDTSSSGTMMMDFDLNHGAHPQFNLDEGNVVSRIEGDTIHGSISHNTHFRNWALGTTFICSPASDGRTTYSCSSGSWANGAIRAFEAPEATGFSGGTGAWYDNAIGNVFGSSALAAMGTEYHSGTDSCTACQVSPATRNYNQPTDLTFGYATSGDNAGPCASRSTCKAYTTTLLHGNYSNAASAVEVWASGVTHTLPASFFHSSKPAWWGNTIPWPAIGPDVTGENGPGGHASLTASNPAQACYNSTPKAADGSLQFDPTNCYPTSGGGGGSTPSAPTGLSVVVN